MDEPDVALMIVDDADTLPVVDDEIPELPPVLDEDREDVEAVVSVVEGTKLELLCVAPVEAVLLLPLPGPKVETVVLTNVPPVPLEDAAEVCDEGAEGLLLLVNDELLGEVADRVLLATLLALLTVTELVVRLLDDADPVRAETSLEALARELLGRGETAEETVDPAVVDVLLICDVNGPTVELPLPLLEGVVVTEGMEKGAGPEYG